MDGKAASQLILASEVEEALKDIRAPLQMPAFHLRSIRCGPFPLLLDVGKSSCVQPVATATGLAVRSRACSPLSLCLGLQAVQLLEQAFADVESDDQMDEASALKTR